MSMNTPQFVDRKLWEASATGKKYQDHMFNVEVNRGNTPAKSVKRAEYPMNCPATCKSFKPRFEILNANLPLRHA